MSTFRVVRKAIDEGSFPAMHNIPCQSRCARCLLSFTIRCQPLILSSHACNVAECFLSLEPSLESFSRMHAYTHVICHAAYCMLVHISFLLSLRNPGEVFSSFYNSLSPPPFSLYPSCLPCSRNASYWSFTLLLETGMGRGVRCFMEQVFC